MLPLLALSRVNWWRTAAAGAGAGLLGLFAYVRLQGMALERARLAYQNPRVVKVEKRERREGPVTRRQGAARIETYTTRRPDGTEEVVRIETTGPVEETRGPVSETTEARGETSPVFQPAARPPRWIAGASLLNFKPGDRTGWTAWGGLSLGGRLDLQLGLDGDFRSTRAMVSVRF